MQVFDQTQDDTPENPEDPGIIWAFILAGAIAAIIQILNWLTKS